MAVQMSAWWQTTVHIQVSKLIVRVSYKLFLCLSDPANWWHQVFVGVNFLLTSLSFFALSFSLSLYLSHCVCSEWFALKWLKMISFSLSVRSFFAPLCSLTFQQINNKRVSTEFERSGRFEGSRWGVSDCGNPYFLSWLIIFVWCGRLYFLSCTVWEIRVCVSVVCTARGPLVCFIHVKCLSDVLFFSSLFTLGLGDVNVFFFFFLQYVLI